MSKLQVGKLYLIKLATGYELAYYLTDGNWELEESGANINNKFIDLDNIYEARSIH